MALGLCGKVLAQRKKFAINLLFMSLRLLYFDKHFLHLLLLDQLFYNVDPFSVKSIFWGGLNQPWG